MKPTRPDLLAIASLSGVFALASPPVGRAEETPKATLGVDYKCIEVPAELRAKAPPLPETFETTKEPIGRPEDYPRLCPDDQAPLPLKSTDDDFEPKGAPPRIEAQKGLKRRRASRMVQQFGFWYGYANGSQTLSVDTSTTGLWGRQTNENPAINEAGHTLSQMWAIDGRPGHPGSTIEFGWQKRQDYTSPRLFVYHFDGNNPTCYDTCGNNSAQWIPEPGASVFPGMSLPSGGGVLHTYGTARYGTDWYISYDGQWVGRIPQSGFPASWPDRITRADAGGEVAASRSNPCTDMGSGFSPLSSNGARWESTWKTSNGSSYSLALSGPDNDASAWKKGSPSPSSSGFSSFSFGGAGYC